MSERPLKHPLPPSIIEAQRSAADPAGSVWLEANAGSGKTRVLTDRVLRLMLGGVPPEQILCLTYTKAAAAEMRQRVSDRLAEWALLSDAALTKEITDVSGAPPDAAERLRARTLFAHALETPGGLKIQTIHAFCESVLHRFPVEAGVPFDFGVVEDTDAADMILRAREAVLAEGLAGQPDVEHAVKTLFAEMSDDAITKAIDAALSEFRTLGRILADAPEARRALRKLLGGVGQSRAQIEAEIVAGYGISEADRLALLAAFPPSPDGSKLEDKLGRLTVITADALFATFLTKEGELPKNPVKAAIAKAFPELAEAIVEEGERLFALADRLARARLVERSEALLTVLGGIVSRYRAEKRARSLLDFDDLIERLGALLADAAQGPWVRYKLDGGLTHILVDESQDTNGEQWAVVKALADEFFAGDGAVERPRTIFAVGDTKQSIYSFQGANPELFLKTGADYAQRAMEALKPFGRMGLKTSFRTLPGILGGVDQVFADTALQRAVLAEDPVSHSTARRDEGGTITLWPAERETEGEPPGTWPIAAPPDSRSAARRVAENIASKIDGWVGKRQLGARGRAVRADDVLVLVQSRSALFHELVRALRSKGLPTPGADRLNVTQHIASLDLLALGDVLLNPADDLQLAALLRSPLFEVDEETLRLLATGRPGTLWDAMLRSPVPEVAAAAAHLTGWRGRLDFDRPYGFFAEVLGASGGLKRFHRRLGSEVDEVLAEFLELALQHEQNPLPSLQGFIAAMRERDVTIKRDLNERGVGVRVMTVHGAKGLEAPIVILADATSKPTTQRMSRPVYLQASPPLLVAAASNKEHVAETEPLRDAEIKRQSDEYWRKLYVGMTRAEDELYVTGALTRTAKLDGTWLEAIGRALFPGAELETSSELPAEPQVFPAAEPELAASATEPTATTARMPLDLPPLPVPGLIEIVQPSLAGDHARPERALETHVEALADVDAARREGIALHALLQHLPKLPVADRPHVALKALASLLPDSPARHDALATKAISILTRVDLAHLFSADSRGEIPFLAEGMRNGRAARFAGRIDRLIVTPDEVLVVDFKSDASPALEPQAVSGAYLTQLGLYAQLATQLFPGRRVRAAILWTSLELLLELPAAALAEAALGFTIR